MGSCLSANILTFQANDFVGLLSSALLAITSNIYAKIFPTIALIRNEAKNLDTHGIPKFVCVCVCCILLILIVLNLRYLQN